MHPCKVQMLQKHEAFACNVVHIATALLFCGVLYTAARAISVVSDNLKTILHVIDEPGNASRSDIVMSPFSRRLESVDVDQRLSGSNHPVIELFSYESYSCQDSSGQVLANWTLLTNSRNCLRVVRATEWCT
jgi:hypothetical protein